MVSSELLVNTKYKTSMDNFNSRLREAKEELNELDSPRKFHSISGLAEPTIDRLKRWQAECQSRPKGRVKESMKAYKVEIRSGIWRLRGGQLNPL